MSDVLEEAIGHPCEGGSRSSKGHHTVSYTKRF